MQSKCMSHCAQSCWITPQLLRASADPSIASFCRMRQLLPHPAQQMFFSSHILILCIFHATIRALEKWNNDWALTWPGKDLESSRVLR